MEELLKDTFDVGCPPFVEPEVSRILSPSIMFVNTKTLREERLNLRNTIAKPWMSKLMNDYVYERPVAGQKSWKATWD